MRLECVGGCFFSVLAFATSCGLAPPSDVGYRVGGQVEGVWDGGVTTLTLRVGERTEFVDVHDTGEFVFVELLDPGESFVVEASAPLHHSCDVQNAMGTIDDADVRDVRVVCSGPSVGVVLSVPSAFEFDASAQEQTVEASLLVQALQVTVESELATEITVNGDVLGSGQPSDSVSLSPGRNSIDLAIVADSVSRQFTIVVERGAAIEQHAYAKASNTTAFDAFGSAIAMDGPWMVVGAAGEDSSSRIINGPQDNDDRDGSGAAYIFERSGGAWTQVAYLKATDAELNDAFGGAVAIDDGVVVVGAPNEDGLTGTNPECGAAYVFQREGSAWQQKAVLRPTVCTELEGFGSAVAISGPVIAVAGGVDGDSIHMFRRVGLTWELEDVLPWPPGFGPAIDIDGDVLVAGSIGAGDGVHVYRAFDGDWVDQHTLVPAVSGSPSQFGWSVAIDGDRIVVSDPLESSTGRGIDPPDTDSGASNSGAVYVFRRNGSAWSQEAFIKASNSDPNDGFGVSVSLRGEVVVVGAGGEDGGASGVDGEQTSNATPSAGAAYTFRFGDDGWEQVGYLKASNNGHGTAFGHPVCASSDAVVAGMRNEGSGSTGIDGDQLDASAQQSGAVYVFR